jgi:hypothetical protein
LKEINDAYAVFNPLDIFDFSKEGENALANAIKLHEQKTNQVIINFIFRLKNRLPLNYEIN